MEVVLFSVHQKITLRNLLQKSILGFMEGLGLHEAIRLLFGS